MSIILLWDASGMWGLLAARALRTLELPFRLVKAASIVDTLRTDKPSLCLVPGGTASLKYAALGEAGREALRAWVRAGGHYLGFCGGAGLALSDPGAGLGLCPWQRAGFTDRLQHFVSGHVRLRRDEAGPGDELVVDPGTKSQLAKGGELLAPVWWPGRFAEPAQREHGVRVLARYVGPGPDLHVADFALASLPEDVRAEWTATYGISLTPEAFGGAPCVIHRPCGQGSYTLSYSHLETPASPAANAWFARLVEALSGLHPAGGIPDWPGPQEMSQNSGLSAALRGEAEPVLRGCLDELGAIFALGEEHGLLFPRNAWLTGWRLGVPGASLNNLALVLRGLAEAAELEGGQPGRTGREACAAFENAGATRLPADFLARFRIFCARTRSLLLAQRLAVTLPEAVPREPLAARRAELFGTAMHAGGLYQELIQILDARLFAALQRSCG